MARKRFSPEQVIGMMREAEVRLSQGEKVKSICCSLGITEQTYYRWRKDYGGMKVFLKGHSVFSRAKCDRCFNFPGTMFCAVGDFSGIVSNKTTL